MVRLVGYFLFLSLMTTGLVGFIGYIRARNALTNAAFEQVTAVTRLKEDDLQRWVEEREQDVLFLVDTLESYTQTRTLLRLEQEQTPTSDPAYQAAYVDAAAFLDAVRARRSRFREIAILTCWQNVLLRLKRVAQQIQALKRLLEI